MLTKNSLKTTMKLEVALLENHVIVGWVELKAIMRILWAVLQASRNLMGATCANLDLHNPKGMCPKLMSTDSLIRNMESGIVPRRDNFGWCFLKEYFPQLCA